MTRGWGPGHWWFFGFCVGHLARIVAERFWGDE